MRLAVTGKNGQVVSSLVSRGKVLGHDIVPLGRPELDLSDPASIRRTIVSCKPDIVVSAAAYTAVDKAESEAKIAQEINERGALETARAAASIGVPIIHLSTDYVFDGSKPTPYTESDTVNPVSVYGRTKLAGELAVASANPRHAIVRVGWIYSPFGSNFVKTMLRLGETNDIVRVVSDQFGRPTSAFDVADALLAIADKQGDLEAGALGPESWGVFHLAPGGEASWADLAEAVFASLRKRTGRAVRVEHIGTADFPTRAQRPTNSRLDGGKLARAYGIVLPDWCSSLERVMDELLPAEMSAA